MNFCGRIFNYGGGVLAAHFVTNILFGKSGELVYNAKMVEGIASCEFPKQQGSLWLTTTQNLELRNILSVRHPPYMKKTTCF